MVLWLATYLLFCIFFVYRFVFNFSVVLFLDLLFYWFTSCNFSILFFWVIIFFCLFFLICAVHILPYIVLLAYVFHLSNPLYTFNCCFYYFVPLNYFLWFIRIYSFDYLFFFWFCEKEKKTFLKSKKWDPRRRPEKFFLGLKKERSAW